MIFLDPQNILDQISIQETDTIADFGCGAGGFTFPLAKKALKGIVYGIDILEEPLSALLGKARGEGLVNIRTIRADLEKKRGSTLPDNSVDWVIMANLLFQVEDKKAVLEEAKRVLKPGGKLLIIDWRKDAPFGPGEAGIDKEYLKKMCESLQFIFLQELNAGKYHWALLFEK